MQDTATTRLYRVTPRLDTGSTRLNTAITVQHVSSTTQRASATAYALPSRFELLAAWLRMTSSIMHGTRLKCAPGAV